MKWSTEDILKKNELSVTGNRKKILQLFLSSPGAFSHGDIEKKMGNDFDRVTIYRTLQTFLEKGIIHDIPTADNTVQYALCRDNCSAGHHHDNHVHFLCTVCGQASCLEDVHIPAVKLPKGFSSQKTDMVISGVCKNCR